MTFMTYFERVRNKSRQLTYECKFMLPLVEEDGMLAL